MPGHQSQIYAEPATMNNQSGYMQPSAENQYAQHDPRSVSVDPYHAQQGAGQGNYSLHPGRDSYSGASYQASLCYHGTVYVSSEFSDLYGLIWLVVTTNAQSADTETPTEPRAESNIEPYIPNKLFLKHGSNLRKAME